MNLDVNDIKKIDDLIYQYDGYVKELSEYVKFMSFNEKEKQLANEAMAILEKKRKKLMKIDNQDKLKKHIKLKKYLRGDSKHE